MAVNGTPGINFVPYSTVSSIATTGYATTATAYANWTAEWVDYGPVTSRSEERRVGKEC